ncbi:zinc-finger domain-containing protein [Wolbachia endosymbiont of Dirofilaria (Dirofilaria) immitis]|uniref:zinc-finger domain-containing protein n=1 Tax=Wolbachia endosymbiont of Dirofilaria (Dirofilaria) immitis TaxID=1812115 RepID=UPI00158CDA87|nr:zinc-finger domain-containing protein [Wolbachia endosymbiont of Dirofilaria (Dirofilaria) immitis]QKX02200.1 zinc-finger domain-containing protein [Wolbachia endosymbiont of Dirofilaria (Dirofilaria) immitis]
MTEVRNNSVIVCCRGDEDDEGFGHPLIYLYKEKGRTFCPYCNKPMDEEFKSKESKLTNKCIMTGANKRKRIHG